MNYKPGSCHVYKGQPDIVYVLCLRTDECGQCGVPFARGGEYVSTCSTWERGTTEAFERGQFDTESIAATKSYAIDFWEGRLTRKDVIHNGETITHWLTPEQIAADEAKWAATQARLKTYLDTVPKPHFS